MDPKLYQQMLEAVAELKTDSEDGTPIVKKLKRTEHVCPRPNCGKIIDEDLVISVHYEQPRPHWRSNCKSCGCYLNPYTQEPIEGNKAMTISTVNSLVRKHYKERKLAGQDQEAKKIQRKRPQHQVTAHENYIMVVKEDDEATITEYVYPRGK